jgi:zinc and cadmium transporter
VLIAIYCFFVALASLAGGTLPALIRLTHTRMQLIMSLVGGLVLGVGLLHLLPHSIAETGSVDQSVWAALVGLLAMFFLIRTFHVHHHGPVDGVVDHKCEHDHPIAPCDHGHISTDGQHCDTHRHPYSWIGLCIGLTLHTLFDGMAIAASVSAESLGASDERILLGFGTFLAVLLHKPLDAMSITTVMATSGWSSKACQVVNVGFALMNAVGAALFCLGIQRFAGNEQLAIGLALGFSAGVFLCISLADILPEVQFHRHDRVKLSTSLLLGVLLAYAIGFVESPHQHNHAGPHSHEEDAHGQDERNGHQDNEDQHENGDHEEHDHHGHATSGS